MRQKAFTESTPSAKPDRRGSGTLVILLLLVLVPFIGGARLASAPVFVYWPGAEWRKPLYLQPRDGAQSFGGPFYKLEAGKYSAAFRMRSGVTPANASLASLRLVVYNNLGTTVFARTKLDVTLREAGYHEEEIAFNLPVASVVETQVIYTGA